MDKKNDSYPHDDKPIHTFCKNNEKFGVASLNNGQSRFLKIFTKKKFKLGLLKICRYRIYINPFLL